ncbi:Pc12g02980 [Penicillium rubens Wisconsin 54-1255]|uniref:Pc12g02980 protein n=1 Tax=Penicillium rubens (strain ATCC 28089 / DSM 1075 / NRRL 1951 / Wisconsin 54-1255) TaxID=500485 RepID=B6H0K7_PENRW|nr:Pc12g02980 [Penicillium rubens Wisconsin 54-1255]
MPSIYDLMETASQDTTQSSTQQDYSFMDPIPKDVSDPTYRSRSLILTAWPPDARAIPLASNPEFHTATKHIAIRFHRLREEVAAGSVCFVKIPTAQMAADGMTKPLAMEIMFRRWIAQIGLHLGARVEEMLISLVHTIIEVRQVRGQQHFYRCHVAHFLMNIPKVYDRLPLLPTELDLVVLRPADTADRPQLRRQFNRDFTVRRAAVTQWLQFLTTHHPGYRHLTIDPARPSQLPLHRDVSDLIPSQIQHIEPEDPPAPSQQDSPVQDDLGPEATGACYPQDEHLSPFPSPFSLPLPLLSSPFHIPPSVSSLSSPLHKILYLTYLLSLLPTLITFDSFYLQPRINSCLSHLTTTSFLHPSDNQLGKMVRRTPDYIIDPDGEVIIILRNADSPFAQPLEDTVTGMALSEPSHCTHSPAEVTGSPQTNSETWRNKRREKRLGADTQLLLAHHCQLCY